jgi:chromate transporter
MSTAARHVSFWEAFRYWLKLGFISFGGPTGQIAIMHTELVERRRWISEYRFLHALNYCMVLPGPEATQLAAYIGWLMHGTWGGIVAGALFVIPSIFILMALSWIYMAYGQVPVIAGIFYGIKPAVVAIVVFAAYRIGSRAIRNGATLAIAVGAFVAIFAFNVPFPLIVAAAGVLGFLGSRVWPEKFTLAGGHGGGAKALIDDHAEQPEHTKISRWRLTRYAAVGLACWAVPMALLALWQGWSGTFTQMGWFFTKAALLTIGGAYAVLPYVYQNAVGHYQWLSATQMIDGLALGETTPGPLIMVVAFVGFVGGWQVSGLGVPGAILGNLVASYFTFLPSFVFILLGAPFVEATHGELKFTAPLTGITAAVVGVVLNLAFFFGKHVLFPQVGGFEWFSALVGLVALIGLWRFKWRIIPVVLGSGSAGMVFKLLGG